jgi:hypothetical protein
MQQFFSASFIKKNYISHNAKINILISNNIQNNKILNSDEQETQKALLFAVGGCQSPSLSQQSDAISSIQSGAGRFSQK